MNTFHDRIKLRVYGSQTYVINLLNKKNIAIFRAIPEEHSVLFEIDGKDKRAALDALEKDGRRYEALGRRGVLFTLKKAARKFGLIAGLLIVISAMFLYSERLYGVEFSGDAVDQTAAMAILSEQGVSLPSFGLGVDRRKLETALLKLDRVSSATVEKVGNRLKLTFLTELTPPPVVDMTEPTPVVSGRDAVVTRVILMSGTALVKPGDSVRAGQTLIAPYVTVGEAQNPVRGVGEVYGKVYRGKTLLFPDTVMTASRTGRSKTVVEIRLFGISTAVEKPFPQCEEEVSVLKNSPVLPIEYAYHTFYETEFIPVPFDFEREKDALVKEGFASLEAELPEGAKVTDRFFRIKRVDNSSVLELYYETEELLNVG